MLVVVGTLLALTMLVSGALLLAIGADIAVESGGDIEEVGVGLIGGVVGALFVALGAGMMMEVSAHMLA